MFHQIEYSGLRARQKENYNFHKVASKLADYGFHCIRLNDDWEGPDFLACHIDGEIFKVQLKGRLTLDIKYNGKEMHVAFRYGTAWYLYPHDTIQEQVLSLGKIGHTASWKRGHYSWGRPPKWALKILRPYLIE